MPNEQSWKIIRSEDAVGDGSDAGDSDTPLIECPRGHERLASRQERTESVIWCEKCGQSYQIDWSSE